MKKCPYCAEEIQDEAIKCKYCKADLSKEPIPAVKPAKNKKRLGLKLFIGLLCGTIGILWVLSDAGVLRLLTSIEDIQSQTKTIMQKDFDTNNNFAQYHLQVKSIELVHEADNKYTGFAVIDYKEQEHRLGINVVYDGKSIMYKTDQLTFLMADAIQ